MVPENFSESPFSRVTTMSANVNTVSNGNNGNNNTGNTFNFSFDPVIDSPAGTYASHFVQC